MRAMKKMKMKKTNESIFWGDLPKYNLQLQLHGQTDNPMSIVITKNISISVLLAPAEGTLLSSGASFTVPDNVYYVSICALYEQYVEGSGKSSGYTDYGCAVKRVAVAPGTTYSGLNNYTGRNGGYTYYAGFCTYYNHPQLGAVPSYDTSTYYRVYVDDGIGTVYIDASVRSRYNNLTGGSLPT